MEHAPSHYIAHNVQMLEKNATSILDVSVDFQFLDKQGNSLNTVEIALLQEEVPLFVHAKSCKPLKVVT